MILDDLFESGMSRVLDTMREIKTLSDDEFIQAHDMSKHMWVRTNWPVIKSVASDDSEIKKHLQKPVGDEHLRHGSAVPPVTEGIMDVIKQTFNDNVADWPMGTSDEQFIQGWARDIKAQTGKTIPTAKLVQLYNHYTKRSPELMQTHGTTESQVKEFAPGGNMEPPVPPVTKKRDPWEDDDRSIYPRKIQQLLAAGNKVDSRVPGAMGHIYRANDLSINMKRLNKPYSQKRYAWYIPQDRDDKLLLKQEKPGYYVLYDRDWLPQGPVVEDVSGLTDAEYNTVARYAKSKYPAMVMAALGRNPDGSINVRMHDTKGLGITKEFKVRFEETDIDEQAVAEADETSWTANSAQFRKEEDMSWTFKITIEPNSDVNKGRGRKEVTKIVSGQSMDAAKKKIREYYLRNGWEVVGIEQIMPEMDKSQPSQERHGDYPLGAKGTTVKPVKAKKVVKDLAKDFNRAFAKEKPVKEQGVAEGWKAPVAALATVGALAGGVVANPDLEIDGRRYQKTTQHALSNAPADARTVTKDGKTYKVWSVRSGKHRARKDVYAEVKPVDEGSQTFGKLEPYWVCVNGKKWKRFDTYAHARAVHDRLEKKLRSEGSDKKVSLLADDQLDEKQDACYNKVKSRYKVWPSAYASGALVQCRKKGAANWGNKSKK